MKPRNITRAISRYAIAACLLLAGGSAIAAVANTPHNLGTSAGTGKINTFSGTAEICVFCHTPHGGDVTASVPLWNKDLTAAPVYTTYDSLGTSSLDGDTAPVGSVSIACLSCHDGTQAMDSVLNAPNTGMTGTWTGTGVDPATGFMTAPNAMLGADLTNDHPIGIQYGGGGLIVGGGTMNDPDFVPAIEQVINGTSVWWVDTAVGTALTREKTDMQLYTRTEATVAGGPQPFVECASCHDPHSENATFLRVPNAGSAVCLACHIK